MTSMFTVWVGGRDTANCVVCNYLHCNPGGWGEGPALQSERVCSAACITVLPRHWFVTEPSCLPGWGKMNLSFAGCGFMGVYHLGVASCFQTFAPEVLSNKGGQQPCRHSDYLWQESLWEKRVKTIFVGVPCLVGIASPFLLIIVKPILTRS